MEVLKRRGGQSRGWAQGAGLRGQAGAGNKADSSPEQSPQPGLLHSLPGPCHTITSGVGGGDALIGMFVNTRPLS